MVLLLVRERWLADSIARLVCISWYSVSLLHLYVCRLHTIGLYVCLRFMLRAAVSRERLLRVTQTQHSHTGTVENIRSHNVLYAIQIDMA